MPILPDLSLDVRPAPKPSMGIARIQTRSGFEDIPARVAAQVGADVTRLGAQIFQAKERHDALILDDAYNEFLSKKMDLEYGEDGYRSRGGADATSPDFREKQNERLDVIASGIESTLKGDNQKVNFNRRVKFEKVKFNAGLVK